MAVTNREIIETEKALRGITEEIHTFQKWKELGFCVRKGEHSEIKFAIWKHTTKKNKETGEESNKMFMQTAAFFTEKQVERITT